MSLPHLVRTCTMPFFTRPKNHRPRHGFTLLELLVSIAVIAVLIAILLPALRQAREHAMRVRCASNVRQLSMGTMVFGNDHRNHVPYMGFDAYGRYCLLSDERKNLYVNYGLNTPMLWYCPSGLARSTKRPSASQLKASWFTDEDLWGGAWNGNNQGQVGYGYWVGPGRGSIALPLAARAQVPIITRFDESRKPHERILWVDTLHEPGTTPSAGGWGLPFNTHDSNGDFGPVGAMHGTVDGHVEWRVYVHPDNYGEWFGQGFVYVK